MRKQKNQYYKILSYLLSIGFIIISGCKTKNVETSETEKYNNKPNNSLFDTASVNKCVAIYGVLQIIYAPIEKDDYNSPENEPNEPLFDEK